MLWKPVHPSGKIVTEVPLHTNFGAEVLPSDHKFNSQANKEASKLSSQACLLASLGILTPAAVTPERNKEQPEGPR